MNRATRLDKGIVQVDARFELLKALYEIDMLKGRITKEEYNDASSPPFPHPPYPVKY